MPLLLLLACRNGPQPTGSPEDCWNGVDDDLDGLVDCEDEQCSTLPECIENCLSDEDDDGDGLVNCADDDCWGMAECQTYTAQVLAGTYRYSKVSREWNIQDKHHIRYADKPGSSADIEVLNSETFNTGEQIERETNADGILWVRHPGGSSIRCNWTLEGHRRTSSGWSRSQDRQSWYFTEYEDECVGPSVRSSSVPRHSYDYATSHEGELRFSSACPLPDSQRRIFIDGMPSNRPQNEVAVIPSSFYGSSAYPFEGSCGFTGMRFTNYKIHYIYILETRRDTFGSNSTTWQW